MGIRGQRGSRAFGAAVLLGLAMMSAAPCHAAFIYVTPPIDVTTEGGTVDFEVGIGGLEPRFGPGGDQIVSAFDLDFFFNPSVLSFSGLTFGSTFGCDEGAAFCEYSTPADGLVDLAMFSFLFDDELAAAQGPSVLLATLSFTGLAPGFSFVGVDGKDPLFSVIGRDFGDLPIRLNLPALAIVKPVPEPGTVALLGLGLLGLAVSARRRRSQADHFR